MNHDAAHNETILTLRARDYGRFLCVQLARSAQRPALYTIAAFHAELAHIAHSVSEPLIGHIRLAWWRETLDEISAGKPPRAHPLAQALAELLAAHPDLAPLLYQPIEARAADLESSAIADESYHDHTAGALHLAWARVLDATAAREHEARILTDARAYAADVLPMDAERFPRSLKPLSGLAALARLRARGRISKLAQVVCIIKLNIM